MVISRTLSLVIVLAAAATAAAQPAPSNTKPSLLAPPSDWGSYYSGGPYRPGTDVTLPDGRKATIVGDFRTIPNGTASKDNPGRFRYSVLTHKKGPTDATKDCPDFGLEIVTLELVDGKAVVTGGTDADKMLDAYDDLIASYRRKVFEATQQGRDLQKKADESFEKWNKRNDRSKKKFSTVEGYTSLLTDMALAGTADKAKKLIKKDDIDKIFKEAVIDAVKEKLSGDLPLNAPGPEANTAAAAELAKGNIKEYIKLRMKDVPENGRAEVATKLLVQFGALAMDSKGGEDLSELAFEAVADVAVEVGLSRYPIAGPMAKEALELAKQFRGYLITIDKLEQADAAWTQALNAFNESYGARQSIVLMQKHKQKHLKEASDLLFKEDPLLEAWVVGKVADGLDRGRKLFATLPLDTDPKMGPPAPADAKKPLLPVLPLNDELYDTWKIPSLIENAGKEYALVEVDRLDLRNKKFVPSTRGVGGMRRWDDGERLPSSGFGDPATKLTEDMRRIFSGGGLMGGRGRGFELELVPPAPPKPTLDEKQLLERDCRLKRMAQAEKLVPRIGPQARRQLAFRVTFSDADLPDLGDNGLNVYRFDGTKTPQVIRILDAKKASGAGLYRGLGRD